MYKYSVHHIYKYIYNAYILIWCLYYFHWYATGAIPILESFANILLGLNLTLSIIAFFIILKNEKLSIFFISINWLLILFLIYGTLSVLLNVEIMHLGNRVNNAAYMIGPLRTFLPIYFFYLFTKLGCVTVKNIKIWFFVFLLLSLYFYDQNQYLRFGEEADELFTNNTGYLFATLFPFVYFFKKNQIIQYVILAILFIFTILAIKRGAILVALVCILCFIINQFKSNKKTRFPKLYTFFLVTIFIVIIAKFSYDTYVESDSFQYRIEQTLRGNDSLRGELRREMLDAFILNSNFIRTFFGFGADGTLKIAPNYAHNDWLEMLIDQGFIGLLSYFLFWISFLSTWKKFDRLSVEYRIIEMIIYSGIIRTFFSMWYSNTNIFVALPLGFCLAQLKK